MLCRHKAVIYSAQFGFNPPRPHSYRTAPFIALSLSLASILSGHILAVLAHFFDASVSSLATSFS